MPYSSTPHHQHFPSGVSGVFGSLGVSTLDGMVLDLPLAYSKSLLRPAASDIRPFVLLPVSLACIYLVASARSMLLGVAIVQHLDQLVHDHLFFIAGLGGAVGIRALGVEVTYPCLAL